MQFRPKTVMFRQMILYEYGEEVFSTWTGEDPTNANNMQCWNTAIWDFASTKGRILKLTEEEITAVYVRLLLMPLQSHARITLLSLASYFASEGDDNTWFYAHQPSNQDVIYAWYRFSLDNRSFWDPAFHHEKNLPATEKQIMDSFERKLELEGFSRRAMKKKQKKQVSTPLYEEYLKLLREEVADELYVTHQEVQEIRTLVDGIKDQSTRGEELQQDMGFWSQERLSRRLRFDNSALRERQFQQGSQSRQIQPKTSQ
ncbi:MAG: hypothetical protein GY799_29265, partial [Desulfobulbaceae bacterium]|nr:hypothetical protein [Desulfobulbaceae bacterium]